MAFEFHIEQLVYKTQLTCFSVPRNPGIRKSNKDHNSNTLFCNSNYNVMCQSQDKVIEGHIHKEQVNNVKRNEMVGADINKSFS